jgi:Cu/Ag efflux pump CusA
MASLPRGTNIVVRGQVVTMRSSFIGLGVGLVGAILLVYLLIVVNFQSWLDPFIIITALPGALGGDLLVPAADAHHAERAVADRRRDVHGSGHGELDPDGELRARADG